MNKSQKKAAKKARQALKLSKRKVIPSGITLSIFEEYAATGTRPDHAVGKPFHAPNSEAMPIDVNKVYTFYHATDRDVSRLIQTPAMVTHPNGTAFHFGDNADDVRTFGQLIIKVDILGEHLIDLGVRTRVDSIFADLGASFHVPINEYLFSETSAKHIFNNGVVSVGLSCNLKFGVIK